MVGVVAALVLVVAPLPLAPDALAASGARTCVTSQLQQVPGFRTCQAASRWSSSTG